MTDTVTVDPVLERTVIDGPGIYPGLKRGEVKFDLDNYPLSYSTARSLITNPKLYRWKKKHPDLDPPTREMEFGTAVHAWLLGTGEEDVRFAPETYPDPKTGAPKPLTSWRSDFSKSFAAETRTAGAVPLLSHQQAVLDDVALAVAARTDALAGGDPEVLIVWFDETVELWCQAWIDLLPTDRPVTQVVDLKVGDPDPGSFKNKVIRYRYDIQDAMTVAGLTALGVADPDLTMTFVVVSPNPPHLCEPFRLVDDWGASGRNGFAQASKVFVEVDGMTDEELWGYSRRPVIDLERPAYA